MPPSYLTQYVHTVVLKRPYYASWKRKLIKQSKTNADYFRMLEYPVTWQELFVAMSCLGFTRSEVRGHVKTLQLRGKHYLARALMQATRLEPSFDLLE